MRQEVARDSSGSFYDGRKAANSKLLEIIPKSAGPRIVTERGGAAHSRRPPGCQTYLPRGHLVAIMLAPSPGVSATFEGLERRKFDAQVGSILIVPAGWELQARWSSCRDAAVVAFAPESLLEVAEHEPEIGDFELQPPPLGTTDLQALQMAQALASELDNADVNELYLDSLIVMLGVHLLRSYTSSTRSPLLMKSGLSPRNARRVQEFMAANFARKLRVADLAHHCGLSPSHFIRTYRRTFGEAPHRTLTQLRLGFATKLLRDTELPFSEIAYLAGFSSQSHLISTMKKFKGVTPARVRAKAQG